MNAKKWQPLLAQGLLAGSLAGIFSTAVLALAGRRKASSTADGLARFRLTPKRFMPGDEQRLSNEALVAVYAALALGLAAGALALCDRYRDEENLAEPEPEEPAPRIVRHVRAGHARADPF